MKRNKKHERKYPHQWGKSFTQDLDRIMGGKGNAGERKRR